MSRDSDVFKASNAHKNAGLAHFAHEVHAKASTSPRTKPTTNTYGLAAPFINKSISPTILLRIQHRLLSPHSFSARHRFHSASDLQESDPTQKDHILYDPSYHNRLQPAPNSLKSYTWHETGSNASTSSLPPDQPGYSWTGVLISVRYAHLLS